MSRKDDRCLCCGCFLAEVDASTEAGWDFDLVCNNKKCRSNKPHVEKEQSNER